jgi:probable DNA metabolism protein
MSIYLTDGSFEGLLCAIFKSYSNPLPSEIFARHTYQINLFDAVVDVTTEESVAKRVIKGIGDIGGPTANRLLLKIFLSEFPDANMLVFRLVRKLMYIKKADFLKNYADADVLRAAQISKMINREVHRMHAFVRFQKLKSGEYIALVDPDFDVMPLLDDHFVRRFADMAWTIFDTRRGYGIYFDTKAVEYILNIPADFDEREQVANEFLDEKEKAFQALWKAYFDSVNIKARKNDKHHLRQLPKRYWKYLSEKHQGDIESASHLNLRGK